jgi:tetratricopeptide (TPR) repeat protein
MVRKSLAMLLLLVAAATTFAADEPASAKEAAIRLYDRGLYGEAQAALSALDKSGTLDGPLLYRLFFCEKTLGRESESKAALERARVALESETASSPSLEGSFYLANSYANLGRTADAQRVAREMTDRLESKKEPLPASGIGLFQVGKLYQDQARQAEASSYYAKAVDAFDITDGRYLGNLRWALRYVGNSALQRADFESSERALARLTNLSGAESADWDALAISRVRMGRYADASVAWSNVVKMDPGNADDPRYAARHAAVAAEIGPLPAASGAGAAWKAMSQSDLEAFLKTSLSAVTAAQERAAALMRPESEGTPPRALDPEVRGELTASLLTTRRELVAAGLEYSVRHYGIREAAFRDGYAVLIFHDRAWELPPDPGAGS